MPIFDPDSITKPYKDEINNNVPLTINEELKKSYNYSSEQEQALLRVLNPILGSSDFSSVLGVCSKMLDRLENTLAIKTTFSVLEKEDKENELKEKQVAESRVEQESQVARVYQEPKVAMKKYANVVDMPNNDNSLADSYPNTSGSVDNSGNTVKINTETRQALIAHSSGTRIQVDQNGNVSIVCKGTLKIIANNDMSINVNGGLDIGASGGLYLSGDNVTIESRGNLELSANNTKIDSSKVDIEGASEINANDSMLNVGLGGKFQGPVSATGFSNG